MDDPPQALCYICDALSRAGYSPTVTVDTLGGLVFSLPLRYAWPCHQSLSLLRSFLHTGYGMDWWLPRNCYRLQSGASTFTGSGLRDTLTLVAALRAPSVAPWYPSSPSGSSLASLRISPAVLRLFTCCRSLTVNCSYDELEGDYH